MPPTFINPGGCIAEPAKLPASPASFTAELDTGNDAANGVLAAMGGKTSGWSLYVKDGRPTFYYNFFEVVGYRARSSAPLPKGKSTVRVELTPEEKGHGKPAGVKLFVNGKDGNRPRGENRSGGLQRRGFDVGADNISAVSPDSKSPFKFTGKIDKVTFDLK